MKPRLSSSKKWTSFPSEFAQQIEGLFRENFGENLKNDKLIIEGRIYPMEILLRVGVNSQGRLRQSNFEVSIDYDPTQENSAIEKINLAVDAAASMMMEYFENQDEVVDFPEIWKEFPFQEQKVFLQFSTENSDLEAQANALLGDYADEMVHESSAEDMSDVEAGEEDDVDQEFHNDSDISDSEPEDEELDPKPQMFKKKKKKNDNLH